ncbi:unnamed protein product [Cochlearia groenlandica]
MRQVCLRHHIWPELNQRNMFRFGDVASCRTDGTSIEEKLMYEKKVVERERKARTVLSATGGSYEAVYDCVLRGEEASKLSMKLLEGVRGGEGKNRNCIPFRRGAVELSP